MNSLMTKIFMFFSGISFSLTCSENLSELDCDYLYAGNVPNFIPSENVCEDLQAFNYLIESSYSGYDDALNRGLNLKTLNDTVSYKFREDSFVATDSLAQELINALRPYINDVHFRIWLGNDYYKSFKSLEVYYSDIFLKNEGKYFIVFCENSENISIGTKFTDSADYLFLYPAKGEKIYRLGMSETEGSESFSRKISFAERNSEISFIRQKRNTYYENTVFAEVETLDSAYIRITDFVEVPPENDSFSEKRRIFKQFVNCAGKYRNKKNIILDLRSNRGGNDSYSLKFFNKLYGREMSDYIGTETEFRYSLNFLISKPIKEVIENNYVWKKGCPYYLDYYEHDKRNWFRLNLKHLSKVRPPKFKGNVFILTDKNTASAAEETIVFARQIFSMTNQVKVIGENSAGCITYGNVMNYWLPNSKLRIDLPSSKYVYSISGEKINLEGKGFCPDYWSNAMDMKKTLINLTGDKELEQIDFTK